MSNNAQKTYVYRSAEKQVRDMIEEMGNEYNDGWVKAAYRQELKNIRNIIEEALRDKE